VTRSLDLDHLFSLDQAGAKCADGYLYNGQIAHCCPAHKCDPTRPSAETHRCVLFGGFFD
jgi:hypothetical protein